MLDTTIKSLKEALYERLTTGLKAPTPKRKCFVILHANGEDFFISYIQLVFIARKNAHITTTKWTVHDTNMFDMKPVSYTHLDVYKRQVVAS